MTTRWTHVTMPVSNIERSIGFYTSFCDLSVLRDRRREGGGTGVGAVGGFRLSTRSVFRYLRGPSSAMRRLLSSCGDCG